MQTDKQNMNYKYIDKGKDFFLWTIFLIKGAIHKKI